MINSETPKQKKPRKGTDDNLVSKQRHEIAYIAGKFGVKPALIRQIKKDVGVSREKIEAKLIELGHTPVA